MSIFDSIKYPISNPPTRDELGTLPIELRATLRGMLSAYRKLSPGDETYFRWHSIEDSREVDVLHRYISQVYSNPALHTSMQEVINKLRKTIAEL